MMQGAEREIAQNGYAHREALVKTRRIREHLEAPPLRIVEDVRFHEIRYTSNAARLPIER
jgi:hypothetical protein